MNLRSIMSTIAAAFVLATPLPVTAAVYYVDAANGNDSSSGTSTSAAFRSTARVSSLSLGAGDSVLFRRGQSFSGALTLSADGSSGSPITIGAWGSGADPVLFGITLEGDYTVVENVTIDHEKDASDAVRIRGGRHCVLRNMIIRNGTRDAVDAHQADGLLIENVEIHHFLNGSFGSEDDSHGVTATDTAGVTIRNADIHHVSGDSFQADPNRSPGNITNDIVIRDSILWTGPLAEDFNAGWSAGDSPGENAIDTKVLTSGFESEARMNITLINVTAHGWTRVPEMSNRAAFNLKEKINAVVDRVTVYNSEIAFRVRGSNGNADTMIANAVIYDVDKAIRAEDGLANLRVYHTTFGHGIAEQLELAGGSGGTPTWDWRNNAFVGSKPSQADDASNVVASSADFVAPNQRDYRLSAGSSLIDRGVPIAGVTTDRAGAPRTAPHDSGAYEHSSASSVVRPEPPVLTVAP